MNLKDMFEIASGTVIGRDHRLAGKNNQDAFYCFASDELIVAVVCDGCGSSPHSEVGAKLGAKIVATEIQNTLSDRSTQCISSLRKDDWEFILSCVYNKPFLHQIEASALGMTDGSSDQEFEFTRIIADYFLFTVVGVVITKRNVVVFAGGDGIYAVNFWTDGLIRPLGPFPGNAPPYPAYGLIGPAINCDPKLLGFKLQTLQLTDDVSSVFIGTDGVIDLAEATQINIPGRNELVGPLSQFWENDLFFKNPDALRRRLSVINSDVSKPLWEEKRIQRFNGLLRDDTTIAAIRRKKCRR